MITRAQIRRQLRKNGGIINAVPRQKYGAGSWLKEKFRKLIPNELANVAVKVAPFVAPFNPGIAGLMRGIGRFDQRGSVSDALKQGLLTYGGGQAARYLGGAGFQGGFGTPGDRFTSPLSSERTQSFRNLFKTRDIDKVKPIDKGEKGIGIVKKGVEETIGKVPILKEFPPMVQQQLFVGGITAGASALHSYLTENFREKLPEETMEQYLEARRKRVGIQMRNYMDNYFKFDPEYSALDEAGKDAFVARYNKKKGGRVSGYGGGITANMPRISMGIPRVNAGGIRELDYRATGGFVPVGVKEKADDVPAMLSKNEFVMTADAVKGAGGGSVEKGAQRMYNTMKKLEGRVA